ncbi:hypothetical protein ACOSQ4_002887 [Xanthoceras sorbifolium]
MASSSSCKHDPLVKSPKSSCSDSSSTGNLMGKAPGANVVSSSPLVSITGGQGIGSSMVKTVSDDRSSDEENASVGISPIVRVEEVNLLSSLSLFTFSLLSHCLW